MDPALQELLLAELDPNEIVEALVRLTDENVIPDKLTSISKFGDIISCRIRRSDILDVYNSEYTKSMKAPRFVAYNRDFESRNSRHGYQNEISIPSKTKGNNTIVAVLDWGIDFAHPNFRNPDGSTRFIAIWDQSFHDKSGLAPYGYGRLFTRNEINQALKSKTPYKSLNYHPGKSDSLGIGTHGTHVMDIAAGNGKIGNVGVASEADLVFVHLASRGTGGTGNLGDSVRILEGIDAVRTIAGNKSLVINMSIGRHGGPHDGKTLVEQGIDNFLESRNNTMICQSTGNYYQEKTNHSGIVRPGKIKTFSFLIQRADKTLNEMEIWYPEKDIFGVELINNKSGQSFKCPTNSRENIVLNGKKVGSIYHRDSEPNNSKNHINLFLYKNAPSGRWTIKLSGEKVYDGRYHAWIERDGSCKNCQSRFDSSFADAASTTGTIANGYNSIVCGAFDASSRKFMMAPFSSKGPTLDGRLKPDIIASGRYITAARSTPISSQIPRPSTTQMSGTSMASPRVAGATALVLEQLPPNTPFWQIRNIVIGSANPVKSPEPSRVGAGKLNINAAIKKARHFAQHAKNRKKPFALTRDKSNTFRLPLMPDSLGTKNYFSSINNDSLEENYLDINHNTNQIETNLYDKENFVPSENIDLNISVHSLEQKTFTPSYLSKTFEVISNNAILRDENLVPLNANYVTSEIGKNAKGNGILIKGETYRILNIKIMSGGNILAHVASKTQPSSPLGWTVGSNFVGGLYNESLRLKIAPRKISRQPDAFTVADSNALIRKPVQGFPSTGSRIPIGTLVSLIGLDSSQKYAHVTLKNTSTNSTIDQGIWTSKSNLIKDWIPILNAHSAWRRGKFIGVFNLVDVIGTNRSVKQVTETSLAAYQQLTKSALSNGILITLNSGFRSYPQQDYLYQGYINNKPGFNLAARPGRSNHQNGIAFDFNTTGKNGSGWGPVYIWLKNVATSFGFFRTVKSEHWHWEYNPSVASQLKSQGKYRSWRLAKTSNEYIKNSIMNNQLKNSNSYIRIASSDNMNLPQIQTIEQYDLDYYDRSLIENFSDISYEESRPDLNISNVKLTEYDHILNNKYNSRTTFKARIKKYAKWIDLSPGLIAVNLISESNYLVYLRTDKIDSYVVGVDDYYIDRKRIKALVGSKADEVKWDRTQIPTTNPNELERIVKTIDFDNGEEAMKASIVYLKYRQSKLQEYSVNFGSDFSKYSNEIQYCLLRLSFNAGLGRARRELEKYVKNSKNPLVLTNTGGPQRRATIKAAQAIHMDNTIFKTVNSADTVVSNPRKDYCHIKYLIIRTAVEEEGDVWTRPNGRKYNERNPSMFDELVRYWQAVPNVDEQRARAIARISAQDHPEQGFWSAAFISSVMRNAGVTFQDGFVFSQRHISYIVGALRNRENSDTSKIYWLYDRLEILNSAYPEPGDIICKNRSQNHSYSSLRRRYGNNNDIARGSSHCDIVVGIHNINGNQIIHTIGGNVSDSVSYSFLVIRNNRIYDVREDGTIVRENHNIFGIMKFMACNE